MGDTLSQEEIDNLLSALSTGEINPDELDEADVKSVRNYNFARPSKFSKRQTAFDEFTGIFA